MNFRKGDRVRVNTSYLPHSAARPFHGMVGTFNGEMYFTPEGEVAYLDVDFDPKTTNLHHFFFRPDELEAA